MAECVLRRQLHDARTRHFGALQVKPGMPYLDVIRRLKENSHLPISAYHVSGEYAMMKAAVERGWLDEKAAVLEVRKKLWETYLRRE